MKLFSLSVTPLLRHLRFFGCFCLALWQIPSFAEAPDATDYAALESLRAMVEEERKRDPEIPLNAVFDRLRMAEFATFHFDKENRDWKSRPKEVSVDEWHALRAFCKNMEMEDSGCFDWPGLSYALFDLDGDGNRDLITWFQDTGSGLCLTVSEYRQLNKKFTENTGDGYTICRDAFVAEWIRLNGRVYIALIKQSFGKETITLLRPFQNFSPSKLELTLHYDYRLEDDVKLPKAFQQEFNEAFNRSISQSGFGWNSWDEQGKQQQEDVCSILDTSPREGKHYYSYLVGEGYADDFTRIVFALRQNGKCSVISITDCHNAYYSREKGLCTNEFSIPSEILGEEQLEVIIRRTITKTEIQTDQQNTQDLSALQNLRFMLVEALDRNPDTALETVFSKLYFGDQGKSSLHPLRDLEPRHPAPPQPPKPDDITDDEWRALQTSSMEIEGFFSITTNRCNYNLYYALFDLDGDGQRDLLIESFLDYFTLNQCSADGQKVAGAMRRQGNEFVAPIEKGPRVVRAKGGYPSVHWIQLDGRPYLAWRIARPMSDTIFLQRPLYPAKLVPTVHLHWRTPDPNFSPCGRLLSRRCGRLPAGHLRQEAKEAQPPAAAPSAPRLPLRLETSIEPGPFR